MLERLLTLAVRSYVRGPAKSWIYGSATLMLSRFVRNRLGRREVVETLSLAPGESFVVEHLPISHRDQIRTLKAEDKTAKREAKAESRAAKRAAKEAEAEAARNAKAHKAAAKAEKRARREARRAARSS